MAASLSFSSWAVKQGNSFLCPSNPSPLKRIPRCPPSIGTFRRSLVVAASSSFANDNREFVIVGGGNAAGYAARTFVEHGMADGRLCIVSKEAKWACFSIAAAPDLKGWTIMAETYDNLTISVKIAMVGKYTGLTDSYLSVVKV